MFYIRSLGEFCISNRKDDEKRNAGLTTPAGIRRVDDVFYGPDETRNFLDVYRPKDAPGKLPVIVSVHGGGWVYGDTRTAASAWRRSTIPTRSITPISPPPSCARARPTASRRCTASNDKKTPCHQAGCFFYGARGGSCDTLALAA